MKRITLFLASMALMVGVGASVAWAADIPVRTLGSR